MNSLATYLCTNSPFRPSMTKSPCSFRQPALTRRAKQWAAVSIQSLAITVPVHISPGIFTRNAFSTGTAAEEDDRDIKMAKASAGASSRDPMIFGTS